MPCYDKKLEAARDDFVVPGSAAPETDACLTTAEVQQLLDERSVSLAALPDYQPPNTAASATPVASVGSAVASLLDAGAAPPGRVFGSPGGSGGYMEFVFRHAASVLFGRQLPPGRLPTRMVRNADFQELVLDDGAGNVLLRFASAYGFRNIQTLMRKIKSRRCEYDYVEIMACPGGCLNGGGQPRPAVGQSQAALLEALEVMYHDPQGTEARAPQESPLAARLYGGWLVGGPGGAAARAALHTQYHKREKTVGATISDW